MTIALTRQLDTIDAQRSARHAALLREYSAILFRQEDPKPGDGERLAELAAELGVSPADVKGDVHAAREVLQSRRNVATLTRTPEQAKADGERIEALRAELEQLDAKRTEIANAIGAILNQARYDADSKRDAAYVEGNVRRDRPRVFGLPSAAPAPDPRRPVAGPLTVS